MKTILITIILILSSQIAFTQSTSEAPIFNIYSQMGE